MTCRERSNQITEDTARCLHFGASTEVEQSAIGVFGQRTRLPASACARLIWHLRGEPGSLLLPEDVTGTALQPVDDQLQFRQSDALLSLLQPMQCGRGKPDLLREGLERHLPTLAAQEGGEELLQGSHPQEIKHIPFRIWNVYLERLGSLIDDTESLSPPTMTCPGYSRQIPEDTTTCLYCGLSFDVILKRDLVSPLHAVTAATTATLDGFAHVAEGQNTLRHWAPLLNAVVELPVLGPVAVSDREGAEGQHHQTVCFAPASLATWFTLFTSRPAPLS